MYYHKYCIKIINISLAQQKNNKKNFYKPKVFCMYHFYFYLHNAAEIIILKKIFPNISARIHYTETQKFKPYYYLYSISNCFCEIKRLL